jgi:hypothetical protein
MTVPFLVTLGLAVRDNRRRALLFSGKVGLGFAILSLGLAWKPVGDGITRSKQSRNLALRGVPAPSFETRDLSGNTQRLGDHWGEAVLVNIWAAPVRALPGGDAETRPPIPRAEAAGIRCFRAAGRSRHCPTEICRTGSGELPASHTQCRSSQLLSRYCPLPSDFPDRSPGTPAARAGSRPAF